MEGSLLLGDPYPDNTVHTSDRIRSIDLEQVALGKGYTELAYLWTGFPTCWCAKSVPEPVRSQAEAAYRATWRRSRKPNPQLLTIRVAGGWKGRLPG